jgi:hypothetical protein
MAVQGAFARTNLLNGASRHGRRDMAARLRAGFEEAMKIGVGILGVALIATLGDYAWYALFKGQGTPKLTAADAEARLVQRYNTK